MKTIRFIVIIWVGHTVLWLLLAKLGLAVEPKAEPRQLTQADKRVVHLYFAYREIAFLASEERVLVHSDDPVEFGKSIIDALIKGPKGDLMRTIPAAAGLRAFFVTSDGTAFVDLTQNVADKHPGGSRSEILTIYSIVNSLILNIPEVKTVRILIGGHETMTLAGHVDIRFPFKANMLLIR
ncbi:MAG: GerMN domain-containing protein [Deltaproteobacteria bacterium]|nr:MAG: GerMN domain-containing protein [Deltaproteobacteria bacterium]